MKNVRLQLPVLTLVTCLLLTTSPTRAHDVTGAHDDSLPPVILGVLDFPNSGDAAAQDAFSRGVMLLHSFEFDDARSAFLEAQAIDPGFAMAIWGEALTENHPLWAYQRQEEALTILAKLPPRGALDLSEREHLYLDAVHVLYGEGSKAERDTAYMEAMRGIYERYPEDLEAASLYGLSILGSVYERDFRTYMKAASILEEVFAKQPRHPGAAHYLIHSYDDQIHAPLGLRAARAYNKIAPSASHAQHMVSHIYTSLGMWEEVVIANENAVLVSEQSMQRAGKSIANRSKHALSWLEYALLQQGRSDAARDTMLVMRDDFTEIQNGNHEYHNTLMRSIYIAEEPMADQVLASGKLIDMPLDVHAVDMFATGYRYVAENDLDSARRELEALQVKINAATVVSVDEGLHENQDATSEDGYLIATILSRELRALVQFKEGNTDSALQLLAEAAIAENSRPMEYGPPMISKPCGELMGEMLLTLGRPGEAIPFFEQALERNTGRTLSLLGLARAQEAVGDIAVAETLQKLDENWQANIVTLQAIEYVWLTASEG
jgi:tetratricopeptide (TPR) repeat protein